VSAPSLPYRVWYDGKLIGATAEPEEAAALAGMRTETTVRYGNRLIWREGREHVLAGDSWDQAGQVMYDRVCAIESMKGPRP
jgi:hypothetical protein